MPIVQCEVDLGSPLAGVAGMDAPFEVKLRAAVSAGWRVLVVEVGILTMVWAIYLIVMGAHPSAVLALWGPDVTWSIVATTSLHAFAAYKVGLWLQAALLAWAWMWASTLRKVHAGTAEQRKDSARTTAVPAESRLVSARE